MKPLTKDFPEININYQILDEMDDKTLYNFCQTNSYSRILCSDKIISDRIKKFKKYCLDFKIDQNNIKNVINEYGLSYPFIIYQILFPFITAYIANSEDDSIEIQIKHEPIFYRQSGSVIQKIESFEGNFNIDRILNPNSGPGFLKIKLDLMTMYNIYIQVGCNYETANNKIIDYINDEYEKTNVPYSESYVEEDYYTKMDIHLWFKTNAILLGLIDNDIEYMEQREIDDDFLESQEFFDYLNKMLQDIDEYYHLLVDFFTNE